MTFHILTLLHLLASIIWIGGMFFAHQCLRPAAIATLEQPALRLGLWRAVFGRFFPWVWGCIVVLVGSGQILVVHMGGMGAVPVQIHVMLAIGYLMALIFAFLYFVPFAALKRAVTAQDWPVGAAALNRIRMLVGVNLSLGILLIIQLFLAPLVIHA